MKSLRDSEAKKLATRPGSTQYLAFGELARQVRDDPASWSQSKKLGGWNIFECSRAPNVYKIEWALLKWSQHLNDDENYDLMRLQHARVEELESRFDDHADSLEMKYFHAIGEELRRQR